MIAPVIGEPLLRTERGCTLMNSRRQLDDRRSCVRDKVAMPASLESSSDDAHEVLLVDVSANGCKISGYAGPAIVGAPALLRIDSHADQPVWVRWRDGDAAGLEFSRMLTSSSIAGLSDRVGSSCALVHVATRSR